MDGDAQLLLKARGKYNVRLVPIEAHRKDTNDGRHGRQPLTILDVGGDGFW